MTRIEYDDFANIMQIALYAVELLEEGKYLEASEKFDQFRLRLI